jgi:hypothetical protein
VITITTIRERLSQAGRVFQVVQRQPGWVTKTALVAGLIAMGAVALVLIIPALVIMLAFFFAGAAIAGLRSFLVRTKQPNGLLDGRRNVKVRSPGEV